MALNDDVQDSLWPGLEVEAGWYHTLRSMILDGTAREMGGTAFLVYNALKCHANMGDGISSPSQERLGELVGMSVVTVSTATSKLLSMGLVEEFKVGRSKRYRVIEKFPLRTHEGAVHATAATSYVPSQFKSVMDEIKAYCQVGALPGKAVTLVFNIALQTGTNSTVNFINHPDKVELLKK